jgi:hypothetical protein
LILFLKDKTIVFTSRSFVTNIAIVYAWEMAISMPSDPLEEAAGPELAKIIKENTGEESL